MPNILDTIEAPQQLKELSQAQLVQLAAEIRQRMIDTLYTTGGHLGAGLGTVELTVALHTVLDSPTDKIVWDVGHQAYPHKMLTGRNKQLHTIRQHGGLSGFLLREESPHDQFGAGHASTSISAALGMAVARDMEGGDYHVVAVIGDGALTGGMALEAINNLGHLGTKLIVLLNDNGMSIFPNVGTVPRYLTRLRTNKKYHKAKGDIASILARMPAGDALVEIGKRLKDGVKEAVLPSMIWEELGLTYLGPIDGHNLTDLQETLTLAKQIEGPVFIHAITEKGKGHAPSEADFMKGHAVSKQGTAGGPSDVEPADSGPKYQDVFARTLIRLAEDDPRIVGITAAMPNGTSMDKFAERFPERSYDVGIAEQHAVTFAAGLAASGKRPVAAIYSTFLQRAYDQVVHDVCMQNLPVTLAMDRAGLAGDDGRTHHGGLDIAYLRGVPNITLMAPKDEDELQHLLATALCLDGPAAIRFPRGAGYGVPLAETLHTIPVGSWETLQQGEDLLILATGYSVNQAVRAASRLAARGVYATVVNCRYIKPIDEELLLRLAGQHDAILTVEEHVLMGGFGSAVLEFLVEQRALPNKFTRLGMPDRWVEHGEQPLLRKLLGLDAAGIEHSALELVGAAAPAVPVSR
ncbi:MAG: 1-deoxy-D-xylulose-5-phosphate synthase [Chloroflexota bacterium]|nr:1-deoxy-D-xylulose-5-phosphate synthase [Chloroflexota bacterium]